MAEEDSRKTVPPPQPWRDVFYSSSDGLKLHIRDYGDPLSPRLPVVCLPGLTRGARDFHRLAMHLAEMHKPGRRVLVCEYRGRGQSQFDRDISHYNPLTEMNDALDGMTACGVNRAAIVGTSRGGIIGMLIGVARPSAMAALILNDIGPVIEPQGLARIKAYVGKTPPPDDWEDAARIQRRLHGTLFTALGEADWIDFARLTYRDEDGRPRSDYDPALAETLEGVELDAPMPSLWTEFAVLAKLPLMAIRGENSDLLSEKTLAAMSEAHPGLEAITVAGEGHPPQLSKPDLLERIATFIDRAEAPPQHPADALPRPPPTFDLDRSGT